MRWGLNRDGMGTACGPLIEMGWRWDWERAMIRIEMGWRQSLQEGGIAMGTGMGMR